MKKQSQFDSEQNAVKSYSKGCYVEIGGVQRLKNKPNSKFTLNSFGYAQDEFRRMGQFAWSLSSVIFLDNILWSGIIFADNKDTLHQERYRDILLYIGRL